MGIAERLKTAIDQSGMKMRDVSLRAGLGENAAGQIIRNPDQSPKISTLEALAKVIGVRVTWLIDGDNRPPPEGLAESETTPWTPRPPDGQRPDTALTERQLARALAPKARQPEFHRLDIDLPDLALCAGDVLLFDPKRTPETGQVCVANVADIYTGNAHTVVRRFVSHFLTAGTREPLMVDGHRVQLMGPVMAVIRAPDFL